MARPTKKNPTGAQKRQKKTDMVIKKLEEAAAIDASIDEMCFYAGITPQTYYNWVKEDKELLERLNALRNKPVLKARMRAVQGVDESYTNAMDYLKRKRKTEFSERKEFTGADGKDLLDFGAEGNKRVKHWNPKANVKEYETNGITQQAGKESAGK